MTTTCPVCQKAVDSLRSRFVSVRDGKVVAYCSAECRDKAIGAPVIPTRSATPPVGVPARTATPPVGLRATPDISAGPPRPISPAPGVPITLDSGPVIEIVREPGSAAVPARADRTEPRAKHPDEIPIAAFWTADKEKSGAVRAPVEAGRGTAPVPALPVTHAADDDEEIVSVRKSRAPLMLLVLAVLAAGGYAIYHFTMASPPAATQSAPPPPQVAEPPPPPAPPAIEPAAAVEQASSTLRAAMAATSPRVSRLAAAALARTEDPAAREMLARQLGLAKPAAGSAGPATAVETSDIARLDLAYSLARGHDKRGSDALGTALASRAEVRDEAARLLALLGDARAVPHLTDLLGVSQRRLGAAEHLAHLAEPHAVKALEQLRADPKALADDRARATIALGIAGHADVAPALREMLGDEHFNAFAADALAQLKDPAGRGVLVRQLGSPTLRVRAARALRRLDPDGDVRPLLPGLLAVTRAGRDTDQVEAAEVILILAGALAWSTYE